MLFASFLCLVAARYALGAQINVTVGGPGVLQYDPAFVTAAVGDIVLFTFKQKNHTTTQSTFESPCEMAPNGFDSGFMPVADDDTGPFPAAQFIVEDTNPVWVYCRQADHCQQGMVFAINPGDKFPAFQAAAMGQTPSSSVSASSVSAQPTISSSPVTSSSVPPSFSSVPPPLPSSSSPPPSQQTSAPASFASSSSSSSFSATATPTVSSLGPQDHFVIVGGPNKFIFSPSNISAAVGDTITFQFQQKNHTVTQSTFANPCASLTETSTSGQVGFDSGFMPVSASQVSFPTFQIFVNDTSPIWAFCRQATHCGLGMVFSVNAVESGPNNFAAFQSRAIQLNGSSSANTTSDTAKNAGISLRLTSLHRAGTILAAAFSAFALLA